MKFDIIKGNFGRVTSLELKGSLIGNKDRMILFLQA